MRCTNCLGNGYISPRVCIIISAVGIQGRRFVMGNLVFSVGNVSGVLWEQRRRILATYCRCLLLSEAYSTRGTADRWLFILKWQACGNIFAWEHAGNILRFPASKRKFVGAVRFDCHSSGTVWISILSSVISMEFRLFPERGGFGGESCFAH